MSKQIILFVTFLFTTIGFSQNTFQFSGKIIDNVSKAPLESATIYLTSVKDSTIIDYTFVPKQTYLLTFNIYPLILLILTSN